MFSCYKHWCASPDAVWYNTHRNFSTFGLKMSLKLLKPEEIKLLYNLSACKLQKPLQVEKVVFVASEEQYQRSFLSGLDYEDHGVSGLADGLYCLLVAGISQVHTAHLDQEHRCYSLVVANNCWLIRVFCNGYKFLDISEADCWFLNPLSLSGFISYIHQLDSHALQLE